MPNPKGMRSFTLVTKEYPQDSVEEKTPPTEFWQEVNIILQAMYEILTSDKKDKLGRTLMDQFLELTPQERGKVLDRLFASYPKGWHLLSNLPDKSIELIEIRKLILEMQI